MTFRDEPNGALLLTGTTQGMEGLLVELLRWRRHAHVVGGPELRARMTEEIRAMAAQLRAMAAQYEQTSPAPP